MSSRAGTASTARRRALASAGALALALGLGLTGCTGGTDGPTTPSSGASGTSSAAASTSPTPTAEPTGYQPATATSPAKNVPRPKQPQGMNDNTLEGQKKFIQYWVDLYNYAYETGDSHLMRLVSDSRCKFCQATYKNTNEAYTVDDSWKVGKGAQPNLKKLKVHDIDNGFIPIDVEIHEPTVSFYNKDGRNTKYPVDKDETSTIRFWLNRRDNVWQMGEVTSADAS